MKKFIGIFAFAAIALFGCSEKKGAEIATLPEPPAKQDHATVFFDETPVVPSPTDDETTDKLEEIALSSSGHGLAYFQDAGPVPVEFEAPTRVPRLGGKFKVNKVGEFSILEVEEFAYPPKGALPVYAKVKVGFKPAKGGEEVSFNGYLLDEPYADNQFCRSWTIDEIFLSLDDDRAGMTFRGCNINEISRYLIEKGVKILEQPASYTVNKIFFAESGKIGILFTGEKPYYGNFSLSDKGEFSYRLFAYNEDDPIIAGEAVGTLSLVKGGKARLAVYAEFKGSDDKPYTLELVFFLLPA